jgi:hypothetical protein
MPDLKDVTLAMVEVMREHLKELREKGPQELPEKPKTLFGQHDTERAISQMIRAKGHFGDIKISTIIKKLQEEEEALEIWKNNPKVRHKNDLTNESYRMENIIKKALEEMKK